VKKIRQIFRNIGLWGFVFLFFACLMCGFSIYEIIYQPHVMETYQPVEAKILRSWIQFLPGKFGPSPTPRITYRYRINGKEYISDSISFCGTGIRAEKIVIQYFEGTIRTVYYNPHDPSKAILIKLYQFSPYEGFYVFHFAGWILGVLLLLPETIRPFMRGQPKKPKDRGDGWFDLRGFSEKAGEKRMLFGAGFLYMGIVFLLWAHYTCVCPDLGIWPDIGSAIAAAPGLFPIGYGIKICRRKLATSPVLAINTDRLCCGSEFAVWIHWPIPSATHVHSFSVGLVKEKITKKRSRWNLVRCRDDRVNLITDTICQPGEDISQEVEFHILQIKPPKIGPNGKPLWRYRWRLEVVIKADHREDRMSYPLPVALSSEKPIGKLI